MRLIIRHLSPIIRSRRRFPFLIIIGLLLFIALILYIIDYNHQQIDSLPNQELISPKPQNILLNALITKTTTTTIIQK